MQLKTLEQIQPERNQKVKWVVIEETDNNASITRKKQKAKSAAV